MCTDNASSRGRGGGLDKCPFCHSGAGVIFVHGHGQCLKCGVNILPCCEGLDPADKEGWITGKGEESLEEPPAHQ